MSSVWIKSSQCVPQVVVCEGIDLADDSHDWLFPYSALRSPLSSYSSLSYSPSSIAYSDYDI